MSIMINGQAATAVLFLSLLQHQHDREVVKHYRMMGLIPQEEAMSKEDKSVVDVAEDGSLRWQHGMSVEKISFEMMRIRLIRDILDNSVQRMYGKNPDVKAWADSLGGLRKVQEELCGLKLSKAGWYKRTLAKLKDELGYDPSPLGEPVNEVPSDSATHHSNYAVEAHRISLTRKQYGELDDDDTTTPSWAGTIFDFNLSSKPWWWKFVYMGKFRRNTINPTKNLVQVETTKGQAWLPDIRISSEIGSRQFKKLTDYQPWWQIQDHPVVKDFIWRFYNDPNTLLRKKIGIEPKTRWAFGMVCKGGYIWAPVTYPSSKTIDYYMKPQAVTVRKDRRALYLEPWVFPYSKVGDQKIRVQKLKEDIRSGLWEVWRDEILSPMEWGSIKKKLLKMGAVDAYFGRPWKKYEAPKQDIKEVL